MIVLIADTVLLIHFCIVAFIVSGLFLIPIGNRLGWGWTVHRKLRMLHLGMMGLVTLEALLGITCPLTSIENYLHGNYGGNSFVGYWVKQIIYWDFPTLFFTVLYFICFGWALLMWKFFPPNTLGNDS